MEKLSHVGNNIVGSEIIKISQQIKEISKTKKVLNLTIGDFDSNINPIPEKLKDYIIESYNENLTNYPLSAGQLNLRQSVSEYLKKRQGIDYSENEILIGGGVRPLIYTIYKTLVNSGEGVIYPVPSWNNNHYNFLHGAVKQEIECTPKNSFFPTVKDIDIAINDNTSLICICSPQNPTGRVIDPEVLKGICDLIVNENNVRANQVGSRPLYLFFDQIYSDLSVDGSFVHPLTLCPEIRNYLICVDGISKSLCATGIRVGWMFGPQDIISKMTEVFSHIGAWAPKPEQNAVARYLNDYDNMIEFVKSKTKQYSDISNKICDKIDELKEKGFRIDCQRPEGGIYISIYLGESVSFPNMETYTKFLIDRCDIGMVPFEYFGSKKNKGWFRMSIGGVDPNNVDEILDSLNKIAYYSLNEVNSWLI
jgi:aspartate aminotransferase